MSDESNAVDVEADDSSEPAVDQQDDGSADHADDDTGTVSEDTGSVDERGDDGEVQGDVTDETSDADPAAETLIDRLASIDDEVATELRERLETLEAEREQLQERAEDLEGKLKRTQADFQNYKKRAKKRQESIQERATEDLVERLVPVRDNLQRALDQGEGADIREGVESTLTELDRVLEEENVEPIEPAPGEEVDPHRHEVLMRVESDQPPETIAESYRPGYEIGDKVLREAQVTVSDGTSENENGENNNNNSDNPEASES